MNLLVDGCVEALQRVKSGTSTPADAGFLSGVISSLINQRGDHDDAEAILNFSNKVVDPAAQSCVINKNSIR